MRIFLFLFAVFIGASAAFAQPQDRTTAANSKKKVFLLAGQSNMDGRGDASKLTLQDYQELELAQKNIRYYYKGSANNIQDPIVINSVLTTTEPWEFVKKKFRL